ncbi:MAG TPA: PEP-CTERM sorting domain-containing protein [Rhodanobacteraceae bacterium]|nr:PEP-CTERM sorting domain-containing protein [Rhodanobacteraceae bacterium]
MNKSTGLIGLMLAALALVAGPRLAQANPTQIATISGAYDLCYYDTPCLVFHNTTGFDFTNAQMVLKGYGAGTLNNGKSQTVNLPNLAANGDTNVIWNGSTTPGNLFAYDYDDSYGFKATCPFSYPVNAGLCAQVGNFSVTFTAMWNGQPIYSVFSPTTNASGGFVGWEGLDPDGWSENPTYDVHAGSLSGVLAYIYEGTPPTSVPEPQALGMFGFGMLMIGLFAGLRRRFG